MSQTSKTQQRLLRALADQDVHPGQYIHELAQLNLEDSTEVLDPEWQRVWPKIKARVEQYVPSDYFRRLDERIRAIETVDPNILKIRLKSPTKLTFLLGAGASVPSGIPTVNKLLSELWNRARKIGRDDLDRLANWCVDRNITNIEDLLTAAYISNFSGKNTSVISLLDYFLFSGERTSADQGEYAKSASPKHTPTQIDVSSISFLQDTLQTLFALLTDTMISAKPNATHTAIVRLLKSYPNTCIITTNYDGCMDEAILAGGLKLKATLAPDTETGESDRVDLIKMHGSINWTYCDSCHDAREFDLLQLKNAYNEDTLSYPVMGICKNCGGLRRPLLVPPLSFKFLMFPTLIDIWNSARQRIEAADYLVIVGYSFSEADTYITKILSRSMAMKPAQKMIIVNKDAKLAPLLVDRFSAHIDGFDKARVLSAVKSSEEAIPLIVKSLLGDIPAPKTRTKKTIKTKRKKKTKKRATGPKGQKRRRLKTP